jgi:hypothetical protein
MSHVCFAQCSSNTVALIDLGQHVFRCVYLGKDFNIFLIGLFLSLTFLVKTSLSLLLAMYFFPKETLATLTGFIN